MVRREVVEAIGLPDPSYFIFYDDVDFAAPSPAGRLPDLGRPRRRAGPSADFDQQHDLDGWKGYYMYRNLFAVHFRYGDNALVPAKP